VVRVSGQGQGQWSVVSGQGQGSTGRHLVHAVLDVHGLDVALLVEVRRALAGGDVRVARAAVGADARLRVEVAGALALRRPLLHLTPAEGLALAQ
jgi:hypothetical protein